MLAATGVIGSPKCWTDFAAGAAALDLVDALDALDALDAFDVAGCSLRERQAPRQKTTPRAISLNFSCMAVEYRRPARFDYWPPELPGKRKPAPSQPPMYWSVAPPATYSESLSIGLKLKP